MENENQSISATISFGSPRANFYDYLKTEGLKPNDVLKDPKKYNREYDRWLRTLDPIQFNRELRSTPHRWKQDVILKLAKFYKQEYNEDWIL
jgi:hypothetical protein